VDQISQVENIVTTSRDVISLSVVVTKQGDSSCSKKA
jgi:hypothetical protein